MAKTTNKPVLQLNSFKSWQYGSYKITQYRPFMFIISRENKDIWQTISLKRALKYVFAHEKSTK